MTQFIYQPTNVSVIVNIVLDKNVLNNELNWEYQVRLGINMSVEREEQHIYNGMQ